MSDVITLCVLIAVTCFACYLAYYSGRHHGRHETINRLIDAKNSEAWQWAHYIRADIKHEKVDL